MRLFSILLLSIYAEEGAIDADYDYGVEATTTVTAEPSTDVPPTEELTTDAWTTEAPTTEPQTVEAVTDAPLVADFVATDEPAIVNGNMSNDYYYGTQNNNAYDEYEAQEEFDAYNMGARNGAGSVNSIVFLQLSLLADGDFAFTWNYDATHTDYNFEYQELVGNYQNSTDYIQYSAGSVAMSTDGTTTTSTLTPTDTNKVFRWRITPFVNTDAGSSNTIDGQSFTNTIVHQPGDVYEGGGGYSAQILLPTDYSNADFVPTTASDGVGYAIAILIQFPAGCPYIQVNGDVDSNYIYTDPAITDAHRIFVFPETHFSNQFSGPIKAFHYYVSNAAYAGCDLTDPENTVTVSVANGYLIRTSEAVDVDIMAMWPSDSSYPPIEYTEQHVVNLTDLIQPATHIGPSRAITAPRIYFSTSPCDITLNVEDGTSPGWGMLNVMDANRDMTDLWASTPTSNTGTDFKIQALIWLTQVGITFRYDTSIVGCETITSSATITFLELDPSASLVIAVNPIL